MTVQAHAAVWLKGSAQDYCSDDAIQGSQRVQKVGEVKHFFAFQSTVSTFVFPRSVMSVT